MTYELTIETNDREVASGAFYWWELTEIYPNWEYTITGEGSPVNWRTINHGLCYTKWGCRLEAARCIRDLGKPVKPIQVPSPTKYVWKNGKFRR